MHTVDDIIKAVEDLSPDRLAKFRTWWVEFDAAYLKTGVKAARDAKVAKLAKNAKAELRSSRARRR